MNYDRCHCRLLTEMATLLYSHLICITHLVFLNLLIISLHVTLCCQYLNALNELAAQLP